MLHCPYIPRKEPVVQTLTVWQSFMKVIAGMTVSYTCGLDHCWEPSWEATMIISSLLSDRLSEARTKFVGGLNSNSLLSDRLGEARTKFVGGLNLNSLLSLAQLVSNGTIPVNGS